MEKIRPFCPFPGCQRRGSHCIPCRNGEKDPWAVQRRGRSRAGRPKSDARALARLCGDITFRGGECKVCESTERYTKTGACVRCARAKSVDGHAARKRLAHYQPINNEPTCARTPEQSQGDEAIGTQGTPLSPLLSAREKYAEVAETGVPHVPMASSDSDDSGILAHDFSSDVCQSRASAFDISGDPVDLIDDPELTELLDGPSKDVDSAPGDRYLRQDEIPQPWD